MTNSHSKHLRRSVARRNEFFRYPLLLVSKVYGNSYQNRRKVKIFPIWDREKTFPYYMKLTPGGN